jgi:type IV pilus assembly protein PilC
MQVELKTFSYTAINRYKKRVKGLVKSASLFEAKAGLRGKKYTQLVVREVRQTVQKKSRFGRKSLLEMEVTWGPFGDISNKELLIFTKKLATMTRSGLPILDSLQLVQGQISHNVFKNVVQDIVDHINSGKPFADAVRKHPRYFDPIYCNMVEAGELTGNLDAFLDRICFSLERMETIRSGIKGAMFYPATLVVVTLCIVYFMLTKVVPTFVEMYASVGAKLPAPTQMIVDASEWILNGMHILMILGSFFALVTLHKLLLKGVYPYRKTLNVLALSLPVVGPIIVKSTVARMSLLMANLFAAGISITEILRVSASNSTNLVFIEAQQRISERLTSGTELSILFEEETAFPAELAQLIRVGEKTGRMDEMLGSIAKYYQEEFEVTVKGLTTVIEPLMIVFVGLMIGMLVVALYLPIFSAGDAFKGG